MVVPLDVTEEADVHRAVRRVEEELGPIDLLVNNAGVAGRGAPSWDLAPEEWWSVFQVNVFGTYLCSHAVVTNMVKRRGGRIVNLASNAAFYPLGEDDDGAINSAYMASKSAVIRFTEVLAAETRRFGVSVFAVSPGMVKSAMTSALFANLWDEVDLWSSPELTADLISFIASGALDALTGRYIHAATDDWRHFATRSPDILTRDLLALRMRSGSE